MYTNPEIISSYQPNDLGRTLYDEVVSLKPDVVIDFGVLNGYSTICIAQALRDNGHGVVKVYDLFEKYEYNHSIFEELIKNLKLYDLMDYVEIEQRNFFDWVKQPEPFDLIHIDISNTGDILDIINDNLRGKGVVLFEGGSEERDRVGWLKVYNKKKLADSHAKYVVINSNFPSISKLI